jgi:hypothetical protein
LGWSSNFVGSETGQMQIAEYDLQQDSTNTPQPLPATYSLYILYFDTGKGGRTGEVNQREG